MPEPSTCVESETQNYWVRESVFWSLYSLKELSQPHSHPQPPIFQAELCSTDCLQCTQPTMAAFCLGRCMLPVAPDPAHSSQGPGLLCGLKALQRLHTPGAAFMLTELQIRKEVDWVCQELRTLRKIVQEMDSTTNLSISTPPIRSQVLKITAKKLWWIRLCLNHRWVQRP